MGINELENQAVYWSLRIQNNQPMSVLESAKFIKFLNELANQFDDSGQRCPHCGLPLPKISIAVKTI